MKKITPEMLGKMAETIEVSKYDWEKQSRTDAWGTNQSTRTNGYWSGNGTNTYWDSATTDSYTD